MKPDEQKFFDLRVDAIRWYAKHPPKTEKELRRFVVALTGGRWLEHRLCQGHSSPWDFFVANYFTKASEILGVGPRGGFKTKTLGLLNVAEMITRPGIQIVHASASLLQATRAQMWTKMLFLDEAVRTSGVTGMKLEDEKTEAEVGESALDAMAGVEKPKAKFQKWVIQIPNGSRVEVLPATIGGLNGFHVNRVRIDEFELMKPQVIDEARMIPNSFGGHDRGIVEVSARKFRNGNVDKILYDRRYKHVAKFIWCVAETVEQCPTERRGTRPEFYEMPDSSDSGAPPIQIRAFEGCGTCALLLDCKGEFAKGQGWTKIDDLAEVAQSLDRTTWDAQMRSRRVEQKVGAVFDRFGTKNIREMEPDPTVPIRVIADFSGGGEGDTAALFAQVVDNEVRILAEYVNPRGAPEEDVPNAEEVVNDLFKNLAFSEGVGDSAQPNTIRRWNELAKKFTLAPVKKLATKRDMVAALAALIQPATGAPRYFVHPRCVTHIRQLRDFHLLERSGQDRVRQSAYTDKDCDTVDAATYLAVDIGELGGADGPSVTVVSVQDGRVETSKPKSRLSDGRELTYESYVGEKLRRMLGRGR